MPLRSLLPIALLALLLVTGCDAHSDEVCTREASVAVAVYDAASGESLTATAGATARIGDRERPLTLATFRGGPALTGLNGLEGAFELLITHPGYQPWTTAGLIVDDEACPVVMHSFTAHLLPE